ncbi:DNA repair protein RecN [Chloroflexota bacterium]
MLIELRVKDLGIIQDINWRPGCGLNVITGETGAGKSLVIDAVEALLSGKADEEAIRHGAGEAQIEGVFALPRNESIPNLKKLLIENGVSTDEETLIIHCELRRQGRSVIRINGNAVPKGLLNQIGNSLIDIHGQSEHLSLLNKKYHLDFLDSYAHATELRNSFSNKAAALHRAEQELKELSEEARNQARREEFLRFQIDEVSQAKLQEGEIEELERERDILSSAEKLKTLSYEAYQALFGREAAQDSASTLGKLNEAVLMIKKIVELDPALKQQLSFLEEAAYGLEEAARDIHAYSGRLEYDPARLEEIESRLELIRNLKRKYGQTITEILAYLEKAEMELDGLSHSSERRSQLEEICSHLREEMGQIAAELSRTRSRSAQQLVAEVKKELQDLSMPQVEFEVSITQEQVEEGIPLPDGKNYSSSNEGVDNVEFIASTNPGEPLKPLARIASTGELSRFTLALKSALSEVDKIPVLIFDEIDIGVGGRSGETIGKKLWLLSRNRQVICVTHLPQIAVFADAHFSVHKETSDDRVSSMLETLQDDSRIRELAMMLAGSQYTETAINNVRELIQKAESWKATYQAPGA